MLLAKKIFEVHARVQKCHFGNFSFLPKWHFWTCAWNSKIFLAKSILLKHYENGNKKKYSQLVQGSAKSRIYAGKSTKGDFLKKDSQDFKKFSRFRFLWISRHTCKNLSPMVVTRAMANSIKNHALLLCRIWKMGWKFFSSLDFRENPLFVLFPA